MEGGSRRDSAPHWRGNLPPSPPPEVSFIYTRTHTRVHIPRLGALVHAEARGGQTPSQVGWGLLRVLLRCTGEQSEGLAAAQPWHSLASPFDFILFFFPLLPSISSLPSLSPLSGKALPAGEGWEGRESLGRQQIKTAEERKEFRGGQRPWDVRRRRSPGGTLPKVSPRVAHPGAGSPSRSPDGKPHAGGGTDPGYPLPKPGWLLWKGLCCPARGWHPKMPRQALGRWCLVESSQVLRYPTGKAVPARLARSWVGMAAGSQGDAVAVGQERGPRCSGSRAQGISASPWGALGPSLGWGVTLALPARRLWEGWDVRGEGASHCSQ